MDAATVEKAICFFFPNTLLSFVKRNSTDRSTEALRMNSLNNLECVTLFVDDLARARAFYEAVFDAKPIYSDAVCSVIGLGGVMVNLLQDTEALQLVQPVVPAASSAGPRMLMTVRVGDVDEACARLRQNGVDLVNGPIDRPWGRRTAVFSDPSGHMWEIAQEIPS